MILARRAEMQVLVENRKAMFKYFLYDKLEVGIVLNGFEVKTLREKCGSIDGAYVQVLGNELWLLNSNIQSQDLFAFSTGEIRRRKLLCHKKELRWLKMKSEAEGMTLVPLKLYDKNGKIKLEVAVARGKNAIDKRRALRDREIICDAERKWFC